MLTDTKPHGFWVEIISSLMAGAFNAGMAVLMIAGLDNLHGNHSRDYLDLWYWMTCAFTAALFNNKKTREALALGKRIMETRP